MMHRDRAWRRRKAHFELVRDHETRDVMATHAPDASTDQPSDKARRAQKLTQAQNLRLDWRLAEDLRDGDFRDAAPLDTRDAVPIEYRDAAQ